MTVVGVVDEPLARIGLWLTAARDVGLHQHNSAALVTVSPHCRPSARTVVIKRIEDDALVFTSALWTRKMRDIESNPYVALLFHWPSMGRQIHVAGQAVMADRELTDELFRERPRSHSIQTLVSRQGEPIEDIEPLRRDFEQLIARPEAPLECPPDWGAVKVKPEVIEFWQEADDRMHDRQLYERNGNLWRSTRLAP